MPYAHVFVVRKWILSRSIVQDYALPRSGHVAKDGLGEFGERHESAPEDHLDLVVARRGLRLDPVFLPACKEQEASLGGRVFDHDHHKRLDEFPEIDLTGHHLQCLDHCYEVQLLDGRVHRGSRAEWCPLLESRVESVKLLYLAASSPPEIAVARVQQVGVADRFEAAIQIKSSSDFVGNALVVD